MGELQQNCPTVPSLIFQFVPREKFFNKYVTRIEKVGLLLIANFFASHFHFFLLSLFLIYHLFLLPLCTSGTSCLSCQSKHLKYQLGPAFATKNQPFSQEAHEERGKRFMRDKNNKFEMKHIKPWKLYLSNYPIRADRLSYLFCVSCLSCQSSLAVSLQFLYLSCPPCFSCPSFTLIPCKC